MLEMFGLNKNHLNRKMESEFFPFLEEAKSAECPFRFAFEKNLKFKVSSSHIHNKEAVIPTVVDVRRPERALRISTKVVVYHEDPIEGAYPIYTFLQRKREGALWPSYFSFERYGWAFVDSDGFPI